MSMATRAAMPMFITACAIVASGGVRGATQAPSMTSVARQQKDAMRKGGLAAAAAVTGSFVGTMSYEPENEPKSLGHVIQDSTLIVVGTLMRNRTWLSTDGMMISTDYDVSIEKVIHGARVPAGVVTVRLPGGRFSFDGGPVARINIAEMPPPMNGDRYLLFLHPVGDGVSQEERQAAATDTLYEPARQVYGVYLLRPSGTVVFSRPNNGIRTKYSRRPERAIVGDVMSELARLRR